MSSGLGLCVLGLLCLHNLVFGQVQSGVLIFCDDQSVEKAVSSALSKFNDGLSTGHKLALHQILSATKSDSGSDTVYSLQFTSRRSDCPAGDSRPWTECDYLPVNKDPLVCNATVHMTETEADTREVNCLLDDHIVPERATCLGCPAEIDVDSDDLKNPLALSVTKFNSMSDSTHLFSLNRVGHATRQVVAGFRFKMRFDMKKTTCAKVEHKELSELCVPDEDSLEFANCNATVDVAPWRHEVPNTQINCEAGELRMPFSRRRPPGWSPLRNLEGTPSTAPSDAPSPTPTAAKEESSEEDTTASKLSTSPATDVAPFHCPSKPWKVFNLTSVVEPAAPTEPTSPQPAAEGTFSDADLLA